MDVMFDVILVISLVYMVLGLYVVLGFLGYGFGIGLGVGQLMVDLIIGDLICVDFKVFDISCLCLVYGVQY